MIIKSDAFLSNQSNWLTSLKFFLMETASGCSIKATLVWKAKLGVKGVFWSVILDPVWSKGCSIEYVMGGG